MTIRDIVYELENSAEIMFEIELIWAMMSVYKRSFFIRLLLGFVNKRFDLTTCYYSRSRLNFVNIV
jgi:hypothetical protein